MFTVTGHVATVSENQKVYSETGTYIMYVFIPTLVHII